MDTTDTDETPHMEHSNTTKLEAENFLLHTVADCGNSTQCTD